MEIDRWMLLIYGNKFYPKTKTNQDYPTMLSHTSIVLTKIN